MLMSLLEARSVQRSLLVFSMSLSRHTPIQKNNVEI